jgi:Tfp pilus assembly protein PilF
LTQKNRKEAEAYVSTALHEDPVNAKGLYRMAVCKLRLHEPEDAKDFVLKAIKSRDSAEARQLLKEINDAVMENKKKSEKTYKKIFE